MTTSSCRNRLFVTSLFGVTLSNDLTWNRHVECIVKKGAKIVYMLYRLKRACIGQLYLATVYISVVRQKL